MSSKQIKRIISSAAGIVPVEKIISANGHKLILPFWHSISDEPLPHLSQLYQVSTISEFDRDLDFLLLNYKPASVEDVLRLAISGEKPVKNLFFPSFDDGLAECYHVVAPILKKKGIQAAFFINPEFVDNKMLFHRHKAGILLNHIKDGKFHSMLWKQAEQLLQGSVNTTLPEFLKRAAFTNHSVLDQIAGILGIDFDQFLKQNQPYMTIQQIKELQNDGFLIGAHGADHREFFLSSEVEIMAQISDSMKFLIQEINPSIKTFAFPFTDFEVPDAVFENVRQANMWDISFGTAGIKDETMHRHLQRIPMESAESANGKQVIRTEYIWYYLKSVFGKNKVSRL